MIIKPKQNNNSEDLNHRRMGGAFDVMARIFRNINKMIFGTGTIIQDRPGVESSSKLIGTGSFTKSKSVFEIYQQKEVKQNEYNLMFLGRKGTGDERKTNYIELSANSKSTDDSASNGKVMFSLSKNGVRREYSSITLTDLKTALGLEGDGTVVIITSQGDGGISIGHFGNDGTPKFGIIMDDNGIKIYGLPTTNPGVGNKIWNDGGTLKITPLT